MKFFNSLLLIPGCSLLLFTLYIYYKMAPMETILSIVIVFSLISFVVGIVRILRVN